MSKQTAMQELIVKIDEKLSMFYTFNPEDRFTMGATSHLSSMKHLIESKLIEIEKEQIETAYDNGVYATTTNDTGENYYQDTYKQ
jgi:hypothetical protein